MSCGPTCVSCLSKNAKVLLYRLISLLCYIFIGALVFMKIEQKPAKIQNDENRRQMEILKKRAMAEYNMTEQQFVEILEALKPLSCSSFPEWTYDQATSFTVQLLTTTGRYSECSFVWTMFFSEEADGCLPYRFPKGKNYLPLTSVWKLC